MDRPESRSASSSIPPQQSTAASKTDDSSSSQTPVTASSAGAAENSVAYQYVAVQQMTSNRDHIEYQLTVREQPKQSRMCGVGEKADRRPIDPAPIVQLRVITHDRPVRQSDTVENTPAAPPVERRPGHGPTLPRTPGVRRGFPVTTALGDGWEDKAWYLENPYFFMYAMLCNAETDEELHLLNDGKTRYTSGSCVSCLYHLKDIDGSHQGFFVFPDLSIRVEGRYRLKLCLFETIGHAVHHCKSIYSDPFHVYTAKRFPGMEESTRLSKSFAEQGLKVRVRKHPRSRRRGSKRTKDESDASDDAPLASERSSPKRARASDITPASGLPIPQPLAASRMPRSMDARFERADYERKPLIAAAPQEAKGAPSKRRAAWDDDEAMRLREQRGWDFRYEHPAYPPHPRDDRAAAAAAEHPPPPTRDFADGRYADDYALRNRPPPPAHASMPTRFASDGYAEHARSAYMRDEAGRPLHDAPPAPLSPPPHPSLIARGYPEPPPPSAGFVGAHGRSYPPAPAPAPMPSRTAPRHSRPYGPPDHAAQDDARVYDDYGPPLPAHVSRYAASYDARERHAGRLPPSPPQPASVEYSRRSPYAPPPPPASSSQWRSGPPSPNRPGEYYPEYAPARRSPTAARKVATPPPASFAGDGHVYHRRGYGAPAAYESEPLGPSATRPAPAYASRDDVGPRPSDLPPPPAGRFGGSHAILPGRERPFLPPLAASPSLAHGEREQQQQQPPPIGLGLSARDRDVGSGFAPQERDFAAERYLAPPGYLPADWERERMAMRAPASAVKDEYRARDWERAPPATAASRPPSRPY
ncbi:related to velvet A protein [Sporisorium reilianum f. sp. reilianum]|uniref:Related to velvet A protein n=1 Tax=Sporisorium reilianum f. sp. reilianum TaxID=72559 RepID=A0A2N8U8I5_9BASI|nr:related to velvet A protein [Sporisorium reilianum f. sp. reilianum]